MGSGESKQAAPLQLTSWSESEQGILKESFAKLANNNASSTQTKQPHASVSSFKAVFSLLPTELCELVYSNFVNSSNLDSPLTFAQFVDGLSRVLKNNSNRLAFYLSLFREKDNPQQVIASDKVAKLLQYDAQSWFKVANIEKDEEAQDEAIQFQQIAQQICEDVNSKQSTSPDVVDLSALEKWATDNLVNMGDGVACAIQKCAGLDKTVAFLFPTTLFQSHILISRIETYIIYSMIPHPKDKKKYTPTVWNSWNMLYSTQQDGMSISRFSNKALDYKGPTILLVRDSGNHLFGAYIAAEWKISPSQHKVAHYQAAPGCFLFTLVPCIQKLDTSGINNNHAILMCDTLMRGGGNTELIAFGGQLGFYRMQIDEGVTKGCCRYSDTSYKAGNLLRDFGTKVDASINEEQSFDIVGLELWGGGGDDVYTRQHEQKIRDDQLAVRMRKINRKLMFQGQDVAYSKHHTNNSITAHESVAPDMLLLDIAGVHVSHVHQADHVM